MGHRKRSAYNLAQSHVITQFYYGMFSIWLICAFSLRAHGCVAHIVQKQDDGFNQCI